MPIDEIRKMAPRGIILTGGPNSVYEPSSPHADNELFSTGVPILGICYGAQILSAHVGVR